MLTLHCFAQHAGFGPRSHHDVKQGCSSEDLIRKAKNPLFLSLGSIILCWLAFPAPIECRRSTKGSHPSCGTARVSHRQSAVVDGHELEKRSRRVAYDESQMGSLDVDQDGISEKLSKSAILVATKALPNCAFSTRSFLTLDMKRIKSLSAFVLLLQLAVLPCYAQSGRRSNSPALESIPSLGSFNGLNGSLCVLSSPSSTS